MVPNLSNDFFRDGSQGQYREELSSLLVGEEKCHVVVLRQRNCFNDDDMNTWRVLPNSLLSQV